MTRSTVAPLVLRLPWPPPELSPNVQVHWGTKKRATDLYKAECFVAIRDVIGHAERPEPLQEARIKVVFVVPNKRKRDIDNAYASIKAAFDAMVRADLLVDDDSEHLRHDAPEMRVVKGEQYVEITLKGAGR